MKRDKDNLLVPSRRGHNLYNVDYVRRNDGRPTSQIIEARSEGHAVRQIGRTATGARFFRAGVPAPWWAKALRFTGAATHWALRGVVKHGVKGVRAWWRWARDKEARPYER